MFELKNLAVAAMCLFAGWLLGCEEGVFSSKEPPRGGISPPPSLTGSAGQLGGNPSKQSDATRVAQALPTAVLPLGEQPREISESRKNSSCFTVAEWKSHFEEALDEKDLPRLARLTTLSRSSSRLNETQIAATEREFVSDGRWGFWKKLLSKMPMPPASSASSPSSVSLPVDMGGALGHVLLVWERQPNRTWLLSLSSANAEGGGR